MRPVELPPTTFHIINDELARAMDYAAKTRTIGLIAVLEFAAARPDIDEFSARVTLLNLVKSIRLTYGVPS